MSDGNYDGQISRPVQSLRGLRAKIADSQDDLDWNKIERVVAKFRKKLTLAQNCRWTDENIEQAFLPLGSDPTYFDGAKAQHVYFVANGIGMSQSCWSAKSQRHCSRPIPGVQDRAEHVKLDYLVYGMEISTTHLSGDATAAGNENQRYQGWGEFLGLLVFL